MRISRHQMFMDMTEIAAKRSTCYRGNTGALIVKDNDIVAMGYNGPPSRAPHCQGNDCERRPDGGCLRSIHAEKNALDRASAKLGNLLTHCDMYTMSGPCLTCAEFIRQSGLWRVFYRYPYRDPEGIKILIDAKCQVYRITPSGMVIHEESGVIVQGDGP